MSFDKKEWIKLAIRRASYKYPPRYTAKVNARRGRNQYECAICKKLVPNKLIQIDHLQPVVSVEGFKDWNDYVERMFCDLSGLQAICIDCHKVKSNAENEMRRRNLQNKK